MNPFTSLFHFIYSTEAGLILSIVCGILSGLYLYYRVFILDPTCKDEGPFFFVFTFLVCLFLGATAGTLLSIFAPIVYFILFKLGTFLKTLAARSHNSNKDNR